MDEQQSSRVAPHSALKVRGRTVRHPRGPATLAENVEGQAVQPSEGGAYDAIDAELRHQMINETAYGTYVQRGYVHGYDREDWFAAEATVDDLLQSPTAPEGGV